jgi:tRNA(Glu) U13 pseudouridine synthase TruD
MYRDFIIKPFPELSMEGDMREGFVDIGKLRFGEVEDDELIEGKKVTISFVLPKGSYATMVVKKLFQ